MRPSIALVLGTAAAFSGAAAPAAEPLPWGQHQAPFDFQFGNAIDTHQQTRRAADGSLFGFFYVRFTDVVTRDGFRVASHVDCNASPACSVGWQLEGRPVRASLLFQPMHDHPVFVVPRADIPQPGSHSHFHWLGMAMPQFQLPVDGYLLQLTAMARFCFIHHDAQTASAAATCRENGGVPVTRGVDVATHLNVVTGVPQGM